MTGIIGLVVLLMAWIASRVAHVGDREMEISDSRLARLEREQKSELERRLLEDEAARRAPARYPHRYADNGSYKVRVMSHAEMERREQERATLQFLRGGKG